MDAIKQKCEVRRCKTFVPEPRVFCEAHWKQLTPKARERVIDSWGSSSWWQDALHAALKELE